MSKFSKKLRKLYGQPKLYKNRDEYNICVERVNIYKNFTLDLNQPLENQNVNLHIDMTKVCSSKLALDVPEETSLKIVQDNVSKINEKAYNNSETKLLPINSYVLLRISNILNNAFFDTISGLPLQDTKENNLPNCSGEILKNLVHFGTVTKALTPEFLNVLSLLQNVYDGNISLIEERLSTVPCKFWEEFYKALIYSPAMYPLPFIGSNTTSETTENIPVNTKRFSMNLPLLPYYAQKVTLSKANEDSREMLAYETVSLEDRNNYSIRLGTMLNIIWKNIATLDTLAATSLIANAKFEIRKYEQLMSFLYSAIMQSKSNLSEEMEKTCLIIIERLREHLIFDSVIADMATEANKICDELRVIISGSLIHDKNKAKLLTAQLSLLTSLLFIKLMAELKPVDHVEKYRLKVSYIEEDLRIFEALLSGYYMQGLVYGNILEYTKIEIKDVTLDRLEQSKEDLVNVHPHCGVLLDLREKTAAKIYKYASGNTFRPEKPTYDSFVKYCRHFTRSVLSPSTIIELAKNLLTISNELLDKLKNNENSNKTAITARKITKEAASWLFSVKAFCKKVESEFAEAFPDLAKPLLTSVSQTVYSVTSLNDLLREMVVKMEEGATISTMVTDLMIYPNSIPRRKTKQQHLNRYLSPELMDILKRKTHADEDGVAENLEKMQVLKMNLLELKMHCTAAEFVDANSIDAVLSTLNSLVEAWQQQQQDIEKKKQDDEALYVTKSKCEDEDDELIAQQEIKEMFPSYTDNDFGEFKPPTLEQKLVKDTENRKKLKLIITSDDVSLVYKWHSSFVRYTTRAEWLPSPKKLVANDVVSPSLHRYLTFSRVIENAWEALDAEVEGVLTPSLLMLLSHIKSKVDGNDSSNSKIDFYHSPWILETKNCVPLLLKVKETTNQLLDQWPDFPTLKDIMVIINRILGFPVTSPVSRLLTGLELLRDKIEEWNKSAHKGNNMIEESLSVGQQIINWRKLEMAHWKESLNNLYQRKQSEAHKYWFYLYNVVKSYLEAEPDSEPLSPGRVISVLRDFMEKSNLVEYEVRLDIIYVYHCHLVHLEPSDRRDELLSILWNTCNYYSQFRAQVAATIKEKRAPIEKKLRDFVKICTWDRDLSYWSVKDTVDKAHKALHKHTKEFENVLKESVAACLVENSTETGTEHVGIWDRPKRTTGAAVTTGGAYMIDPQNFVLLMRNVKKYLDQAEKQCSVIADGSLLSKVPSLLNKAKTLCKDTIANSGYPSLVQALDDFVTMVIETSSHLGALEVDAALPKDKQVSQAKSFVQQKRKALADLFKYLTKMGLNYRTGLVILSASADELYDFTIPPIDLDASMSYLKSRRCDASLGLLWSGCEKYFQKNIARHRLLSVSLQSPHQDLGIQNIERCKGFAAQLMKLMNTQKKSISKYSRYLYDLRTLTTNLTSALDADSAATNISTIKEKLDILTECYSQCSIALDQFNILLNSCPENILNSGSEPTFDSVLSNSPIVRCYKNSDEWRELYRRVNVIISTISKQKSALVKLLHSSPKQIGRNKECDLVISQSHIDVVEEARKNLEAIVADVDNILQDYQFTLNSPLLLNLTENCTLQHPMLRSMIDMSLFIKETIVELEKLNEPIDVAMEESSIDTLVNQTEEMLATMLLVLQSVYKKHLQTDDKIENQDILNAIDDIIDKDNKEKEQSKDLLDDKHLKEHLQDKLSNDARLLQLETLVDKTRSLLKSYVQYTIDARNVEDGRNVVMRLVPILEQTVLFVQYFVTQKVAVHRVTCKMLSVLLKIFSDLAAKGFCKPSDLETEEGEGGDGPGKLSSGTGLGEGEGQKDVSDRIENQDQLEEANRPGEEKKEEDRDCKEEEKGVNMTDDFDSHLQDVEKKDGDESEQEDDEDDADKQMGDIDNAAEKLDQQIWGSEDEDELDDNQEKKEKEEKGQGESTGEKEMGAKEEEQGTDDGTEGKEKKKKKDINEMEEPEIDDDHVDPYHGNHPQLPEPEDLDLPDDMNLDGEDGNDDKDGETETENPFEIDVTKDDIPKEPEEMEQDDKGDETKENKHGFEVSSDEEEGEGDDEKNDDANEQQEENQQADEAEPDKVEDDDKKSEEDGDVDPQDVPQESEEPEHEEQKEEDKDLPKNPDKMEDEEIEQKNREANPQANPSNDDQSAEDKAENAEMDRGTDDNVETNAEQKKDEETAPFEQAQEQVGEEKQSMGRSELDKSEKGHRGEKEAASRADQAQEKQNRHENKPGKTDQERTLGNVDEKKHKHMQTLNVEREEEAEDGGDGDQDDEKHADAYQHVKQPNNSDLQAIDAATKEQADQQPTLQQEDEEAEELKEDEQVAMDVDEEELQVEKSEELKPEKFKNGTDKDKENAGSKKEDGEEVSGETGLEIEGDAILTAHVPRGNDTTYHTRLEESQHMQTEEMSVDQYMSIREWLVSGHSVGYSSANVWRTLWQEAAPAARALCEKLRLVLEPTGRSRRAGDFRTGRAINMRRVIPYIASHFRKDRIWLRRTKPAKREYKIAIAVDDSSSMSDNRSKELAFESLALVSQALNLLESGDLAVLSFGEKPNLLHPFTEQFSEHSGSKILEQLRFEQKKTRIAQLIDFCTVLFEEQAIRSDALNAKLLVVVSDGRGIFSEGETRVIQSVRRARQQGIFLVYVIIDNPDNKDSIMDIRRPLLDPVANTLTGFVPYLDTFPFPFYLILRDMSALPTVLGDALRQWFELAANTAG
ncbi:unnamed protein product [Diatraea saccharalis]|uniref:VWFA domain-containing protein n=1 Tax=Diatraea saccharalis TaxID=40085 RepID=A0A9N9RDK3_9NEOP|nr:unnamed protein product [Diatraea saccharalis]